MATISLSKTMVIIPYAGGTETITITVDGSTLSSFDISDGGIFSYTKNASSFTIVVANNPNANSERYAIPKIVVNAADGTTVTIPVYVFQKTQNITIVDDAREKTLNANESEVYYFFPSQKTYTGATYSKVTGDVTVTNFRYTLDEYGCGAFFTTADNETNVVQNAVLSVSCNDGSGNDTAYVLLHKNGTPGTIAISPNQVTVSGSTTTQTFTVTSNQIDSSSFSYNTWGDITFSSVAYNNDHTQITATWPRNESGETKVGYLSVIGQDIYGFTKTDYTTITQEPVPELEFTTESRTLSYDESTAYYYIRAVNVSNVGVAFRGNVSIDHYTLTADTGGYQLYVYTNNNTTTSMQTTTITVSGTSGAFTLTDTATLNKKGTPGSISLNPNQATVSKASGTITSTVTVDGVSNLQTSYWGAGGTTTITGVTLNNNTLTVAYRANITGETVTNYASITGEDQYGDTKRATLTIVHLGEDPSIVITPASKTLGATETTAYWPVRVYGVSNPSVSITGTVGIDSYTFTQDLSDETLYTLYVNTNNNSSANQLTSTITISGTSELGTTVTGTATLIKKGVAGSITLNPSTASVSAAAGTTSSTISTSGITSVLSTEFWGSGGVTTVTNASVSGNTLTVTYGANSSVNTVTNYVKVSGTDSNGDTQFATMTITQAASSPSASITVTPSSKTVSRNETYTTFTITTSGTVNNLMMTTTDFWIIDYLIQNGVLSVSFAGNNGPQRTATLTVLGTDSGGNEVSTSVTLIQEGTGTAGSITINPNSRTLNATETTCMYVVTTENISRITSVEKSGNVVTTDYHLEEEDFGYYLWVTTADNTGTTDLTSTFTIIGVDTGGTSRTATATLIKKAPIAGSITIEPWQRTVGYQAGSTTFTVTATNIVGNLSLELNTTTTMNITSYTLNNGTLTVVYGANSGTQKNGAINIRGTDTNGVVITELARLYQDQAPATYTFAFNPASQSARTVTVSPTSLRYTIDSWKTIGSAYELGYTISNIEYTSGSWPTIINIRYEDGKPYLLIPMNMTGNQRTAVVHFLQDESDREITSTVTQEGRGSSTETFLPIWRDDVHTSAADDFIEYHISLGADIIYAGKAYKYPDASTIEWTINDVCSNYIGTGITFTGGIQRIPDYCKVFSTVTNDQTLINTRFYNSWAYEDTDYWLSDPIDYRVDPRQWLPVSFLSSNSRNIRIGSTDYTATADDDGWTVMTNLNNLTLDCGGTFTVTPGIGQVRNYRIDCGDFVLYYANAYGGWDALLVKGTTKKTDNIEHMNYRRKSRNLSDFSKVNYQNNITPTWSLNTGITVNGKKMYHLLESNMVYLHNLETNEIIPVVITNAQCEYLDYTNNGKKPYYYNITVEESNLKLRK